MDGRDAEAGFVPLVSFGRPLQRVHDVVQRELAGTGEDKCDARAQQRDRVLATCGEEEAAAVGGEPRDEHREREQDGGEASSETEEQQQPAETFRGGGEDGGEVRQRDAELREGATDAVEAVLEELLPAVHEEDESDDDAKHGDAPGLKRVAGGSRERSNHGWSPLNDVLVAGERAYSVLEREPSPCPLPAYREREQRRVRNEL